jgi:hypothetical protein
MASSKRPPLELDDLTNNLKQSSGKGVDAFFSSPPTPQAEKKPVMQEEQDKKGSQEQIQHPVPGVPPVPPVPVVPPVPGVPPKRVMKERWPVNIYHDQYESLKQLAGEERREGGLGSMSQRTKAKVVTPVLGAPKFDLSPGFPKRSYIPVYWFVGL